MFHCSILLEQPSIEFEAKTTASRGVEARTGVCSLKRHRNWGEPMSSGFSCSASRRTRAGLLSAPQRSCPGRFLSEPRAGFLKLAEVVTMHQDYIHVSYELFLNFSWPECCMWLLFNLVFESPLLQTQALCHGQGSGLGHIQG